MEKPVGARIAQSVQQLCCGLDGLGIEVLWGVRFSAPTWTGFGVH
jgi:hypothetical protein